MSYVTNCLLLWEATDDDAALAAANAFFTDGPGHGRGFVSADAPAHWYGGTKALEVSVAVGAFNYLDVPALLAHLRALPWPSFDSAWAQLCYCDQEDDGFRLVDVYRDAS